jgi:NADH:ubiquinone oxidoreductase subunit C
MSDAGVDADAAEPEVTDEDTAAPEPERRYGALVDRSGDADVLHPSREQLLDVVRALHDDGYVMCLDVTAVDYLVHPGRDLPDGIDAERFEVVVTLISHRDRVRQRLRVQVPGDDPTCPSLFALHPGTEALEREVYDMFGITFTGHPDMTRILMPEDWVGHPLRKDYDSGRIPVQFKGAPSVR